MVQDFIEITTNDADILSKVSHSEELPEVALEMIAVRKGLIDEEGIIPRKKDFESFIKNKRWIRLQTTDSRWQKDVRIESVGYRKSHVKLFLEADCMLIDDSTKSVNIVISDFSTMSKKEVKKKYEVNKYLIKEVAKTIWKSYTVNLYIWQYDSCFTDYEDLDWNYDQNKNSCVQIKRGKPFGLKKSIEVLDAFIPTVLKYNAKALQYEDFPSEGKHSLDDLKSICLNIRLSKDSLDRIRNVYAYNKRRIKSYLFENNELSVLKQNIERFHSDFMDWYNALTKEN